MSEDLLEPGEPIDIAAIAGSLQVNARGTPVASMDDYEIGLSSFSSHPRWEIHPEADEFVQVVSGQLGVTLLGGEEVVLRAGQAMVIPKNTWHSPVPRGTVSLLSMSRYEGTRVSDTADPTR
jgi:mannose-6-phosphate isomerase-like protein (cupin superfamily)